MPSAFETQMAAAGFPAMYAAFGVPAVYTDPNGNVTSGLTVRVHRDDYRAIDSGGSAKEAQSARIFVLQPALAKPVKGGRFAVDAGLELWTVKDPPTLKNGQHHCECERTGLERMLPRRARE